MSSLWEPVTKGILKTLSGKLCQKQRRVILGASEHWFGNLPLETFTWGSLPGNLDLPSQEPSLYLDTFTWEPSLGDLYLATFVKPCQKQYPAILGTFGTLIWEPSFGNLYLEIFTWEPWPALTGTFTLLGYLYLGTFAWGPLLGNLCSNPVRNSTRQFWEPSEHWFGNLPLETFTWGSLPGNLDLPSQEPSLYLDTFTWEPSLGDLYLATFAQTLSETVPGNFGNLRNIDLGTFLWKPLLGDLYLGTLACPHRNLRFTWIPLLGNLRLGTFTWQPLLKPCQKQYPAILGTFGTLIWEPSFGNLYLGIFTWEPWPASQEPSLYLDTFTWEPSLGDLYLATFAQTLSETVPGNFGNLRNIDLGTFLWGPLLGDLYLGTLTCPHRNLHFTWIPLLGDLYLATFAQTLSETVPGNFGNLRNIDLGTFLWKPLLGDLYLGTLTCPHRNLHFTWIPFLGNLRLGTFTWQPLLKPCQKQYPAILGTFGTLIWEPSFGNLYLGIFTWEPWPALTGTFALLGYLYLGTFAWGPLLGNLCSNPVRNSTQYPAILGTFGTLIWEPSFGNLYLGIFSWEPWPALTGTFTLLGYLYLGTFAWGPLLGNLCSNPVKNSTWQFWEPSEHWFGNLYLGILLRNKAHSTHISPSHRSFHLPTFTFPPGPPFSNLSHFSIQLFPLKFPLFFSQRAPIPVEKFLDAFSSFLCPLLPFKHPPFPSK